MLPNLKRVKTQNWIGIADNVLKTAVSVSSVSGQTKHPESK